MGGGQKVQYVPRHQGNQTSWRDIPGFCRDILAVPEKFEKITPDVPQSEIAATNFYDRAKFGAKNWAKFWTKFSGHFRASCAVQNDPPEFLPKFLPIYHSVSCHSSWLKSQNFISASFWGLGHPKKKKFVFIFGPY